MPDAGPREAAAEVTVTATPGTATAPGRISRAWGILGFIVTVVVLFLAYWHLSRNQQVESDGASNALQAWDMLHGNLLLRGWTVTDVSFYTTELPEWMLVEAVKGLNADVLHAAAALTYALMVPLAALLAKGRATGREAAVRMLIAAGILIAPQPGAGVFIVLFQPDHMGTQVPMLLTWLVLDRAPRRWYTPVAVGVLLAWIGVADQIVLLVGVIPLVVVCAVRILLAWRGAGLGWRGAGVTWQARLRAAWFELALAVAAIASYLVTDLAVHVIHALGGYSVLPVSNQLGTLGTLPDRFRVAADGVLGLYGASFQGGPHGIPLLFALLHLAGLALAVAGLVLALRRLFKGQDMIAEVLAVAICVNVIAYLVSVRTVGYWSAREIAGVLPAGAVLAGRMVGPGLVSPLKRRGQAISRVLSPLLAVVLAGYLAAAGYGAARPPVPGVGQDLAGWLGGHGLHDGLAGYGLANATTMAGGNNIKVRPIVLAPDARLIPGPYEYDISWYDAKQQDASFVVVLAHPAALDPMTRQQVVAAFGAPAHQYAYSRYLILTWNKNLLTELGPACPALGAHLLGASGQLARDACGGQ
ncbi:MAG TPA: hypothetical protein VGG16_07235 [Streptosporangiaceae bacterium]